MPFHRMKVRLKREIVTMGVPDIDPLATAGTYVDAGDWNALIADPDTVVIDTRNDYEVAHRHLRRRHRSRHDELPRFPGLGRAPPRASSAGNARSRCSAPAASAARRRRPM